MKYLSKLQKFMYGRYGSDEVYKFLFGMYLVIFILNLFIGSEFLLIVELLIVFIMFYRFFSKNIYKRAEENKSFLKFKKKLIKPFTNFKRNITDKDHIYKKCSKCKTILKLPLPTKRGIKHAKCPECKTSLTILALKCEKIEIIRKAKTN